MWTENLTEMILTEFVEAGGDFHYRDTELVSALTAYFVYSRRGKNGVPQPHEILSRSTSSDYLDALRDVLPEQEIWTVPELLTRLNLPRTKAEDIAMGKAVVRLGWFARRTGDKVFYAKSLAATYKTALPENYEARLAELADEKPQWTVDEIAARLGTKLTRSFGIVVGGWFKAAGWSKYRTPGVKRFTVYTRPSVQA